MSIRTENIGEYVFFFDPVHLYEKWKIENKNPYNLFLVQLLKLGTLNRSNDIQKHLKTLNLFIQEITVKEDLG